jgi:hypothetical protein
MNDSFMASDVLNDSFMTSGPGGSATLPSPWGLQPARATSPSTISAGLGCARLSRASPAAASR